MYHPKLLQSKCLRSAMIPAALLCVVVSGCADEQPTSPKLLRVARTSNADLEPVTFDKFFVAWSQSHSSSPIRTQMWALDTRQNRQYGGWWPNPTLLSFAKANPGRLYINGDEPDQYCTEPYEYAGIYKNFVEAVRAEDPTARFSPAGFAEPNDRCCPVPADEPCRQRMHSIGYADQFYNAYLQRYGEAPPVDEWRFHDFGLAFATGDLNGWWSRVNEEATWSVAHGAKMVLGGMGFHGWKEPAPEYQEHLKQAIGRVMNDTRINEAVYWSYESWVGEAHYLANGDGSLTSAGQTYANPLTDMPASVIAVASTNGNARLQWSNTTSAWGSEAEFWVKTPGSSSFAYHNTARVAAAGATQTPLDVFHIGDSVKGRVRYYNRYANADWSAFSNGVLMTLGESETTKGPGSRKGPRFCFLPTGIQNQPCT